MAPSCAVRSGRLPDLECHLRPIRQAVFVAEQGIDPALEWDDRDAACWHAVVFVNAQAAATGRIDLEAGGRIGRVAVLASHRCGGLGLLVMQELERVAARHGLTRVHLHAQSAVTGFYRRQGYHAVGEEFHEAGIAHVGMEKVLSTGKPVQLP